ncbi:hypothetical protein EAI_03860, partial [Harpegnathos saltator]
WQQDGATAHTAQDTMAALRRVFGPNRLISRGSRFPWPRRSPDLSAADYFLWGYLKDRVYGDRVEHRRAGDVDRDDRRARRPRTIDELKAAIVREVDALNEPSARSLLRAVMENLVAQAKECSRERGGHL